MYLLQKSLVLYLVFTVSASMGKFVFPRKGKLLHVAATQRIPLEYKYEET